MQQDVNYFRSKDFQSSSEGVAHEKDWLPCTTTWWQPKNRKREPNGWGMGLEHQKMGKCVTDCLDGEEIGQLCSLYFMLELKQSYSKF